MTRAAAPLAQPTSVLSPRSGPVTVCFAAATFLGAFLLFLVQPLVARYILPWFGGGAAVWTTCLLFFQTVLLLGYLYAHVGVRRLAPRRQAMTHVVVLVIAVAAALPTIAPSSKWQPSAASAGNNPTAQILLLLAATVGLPSVALSATSPLLHAWYSRVRPGAAVYRLYALSNFGSLLALVTYPLVFEPLLDRRTQALVWTVGVILFAAVCAACAIIAWRHARSERASGDSLPRIAAMRRGDPVHRVFWLILPACASALLLGTTNTITQDFAPVPFLWIVPLALYLITFIVAFDRPRWYWRPAWCTALALTSAGVLALLYKGDAVSSVLLVVAGFSSGMFAGCMVLHGELARLRPTPDRLTGYYLAIAAGGAIGGLLVAVGAPTLLRSYLELPAAMWACCALALVTPYIAERRAPLGAGPMLGIVGVMALAPLAWGAAHRTMIDGILLDQSRDFYGALSVWKVTPSDAPAGVLLNHGRITHGHQYALDALRATPTTYFHADSGVGFALRDDSPLPRPRRVAVVGLGAGTLAAYARAGDTFRFYEISPAVLGIARANFTYLADAAARGASCDVVLGDGRLSLEREPATHQFDVIVLDAFSGDAIPSHLLTSQAFDLYRARLSPGGVVCVHTSNRYVTLETVVAAAARRLGWHAGVFKAEWKDEGRLPAEWVLLGPDAGRIEQLMRNGAGTAVKERAGFVPWTDEHANVLGILR